MSGLQVISHILPRFVEKIITNSTHTFEDHPEPKYIGENLRDLLYQLLKKLYL